MNKVLFSLIIPLVFLTSACQQENTITVKQEDVEISISASGELESKQRVFLTPPTVRRMWQFNIQTLLPENTSVKKGQVVISFDGKKIREKLIDKQGQLAQAEKELENKSRTEIATKHALILNVAEKEMEFKKAQRKAEIIDHTRSKNDRDKARIDFTIAENDFALSKKKLDFHLENTLLNINRAKAKVDRLKSEVSLLKSNLSRLKVKTPIDGLVIYKSNWNGEKPSVGENIQFGQAIIEIAVIEEMQIKAQITEPDSGQIKLKQRVKISLDGIKDRVFSGSITSLGKVFREKSWQDKRKIFDVIIDIDNIDPELMRPGMTARIDVINEKLSQVLTIPQSVIKNDGENITVTTSTFWGSEQRIINISHVLKNKVVVSKGLQSGDIILP